MAVFVSDIRGDIAVHYGNADNEISKIIFQKSGEGDHT